MKEKTFTVQENITSCSCLKLWISSCVLDVKHHYECEAVEQIAKAFIQGISTPLIAYHHQMSGPLDNNPLPLPFQLASTIKVRPICVVGMENHQASL